MKTATRLLYGAVWAALALSSVGLRAAEETDEERRQRLERMATSPYRYILLHRDSGKPRQPAAPRAAPAGGSAAPRKTLQDMPPPAAGGTARIATSALTASVGIKQELPTLPAVPPAADADEDVSVSAPSNEMVQQVMDMANAHSNAGGLIEDRQTGGYVTPLLTRYSERSPNPVEAQMALDSVADLLHVSYKVPATVGTTGVAGVWLQLPGDGADLSSLLVSGSSSGSVRDQPPPGSGLLEIELDVTVPTVLRIGLMGPVERNDGAYPYFVLPVQPGRRTYGLWLEDFRRPSWSPTAPDAAAALRRVLAVAVEYSRGEAQGRGDEGRFSVGRVAFTRSPKVPSPAKL